MKKEEGRKMIEELKNKKGFIAALDQSGGSSKKTLSNYGIENVQNDEEMFQKIHEMRSRIIRNEAFTSSHILGVILFKHTMDNPIDGKNTVLYLKEKNIPAFLKIDVGLAEKEDGVELLKEIPNLETLLEEAKKNGIIGTKMRSVIHEYNEFGIKQVIEQQFTLAKTIIKKGLIPIIEPEVDINSTSKMLIETFMKSVIRNELNKMAPEDYVIFKFTLPERENFYDDLLKFKNVLRIVALSGGYSKDAACEKLKQNKKMTASFSRAFLEGLNVSQTEEEFTENLKNNIDEIYSASVNKI